MNLEAKEKIEIDFWKDSKHENPEVFSLANYLNKLGQLKILNTKINKHIRHFRKAKNVLELGAGQGWASAFMKKWIIPSASFTVTDISSYAVESVKYWEQVFDVEISDAKACKSYDLSHFKNEKFDLVFCYAAAHHFVKLEETLQEVYRVLKPSGKCVFLYEPTCSRMFYKIHFKWVNGQRPHVPEDVLVTKEIIKMGENLNFKVEHSYDFKSQDSNSIIMTLYFKFLSVFTFLQGLLPSSSDFVFIKPMK